MASRSISAVRTWARNPDVGDEKGCVSGCRSALSGERSARWPPEFSAESSSPECSRRLPEPLGFSSLLMAPYPDVFSASYSNAEAVCAIPQHGHNLRDDGAANRISNAESITSEGARREKIGPAPHLRTKRVRTKNLTPLLFSRRNRKHGVARFGH